MPGDVITNTPKNIDEKIKLIKTAILVEKSIICIMLIFTASIISILSIGGTILTNMFILYGILVLYSIAGIYGYISDKKELKELLFMKIKGKQAEY